MSIHDRDLRDFVFNDPPPEEDRQTTLRREVIETFDYRRKKNTVVVTFYILACIALMLGGSCWLASAYDTKGMLLAFFLMVAGLETSVLVKLWFWVVDSRDVMAKEIKQVQLQLATLAAHFPNQPARGDEKGESRDDNA